MNKAWLIARREIAHEIFGDRGSFLRMLLFVALPVVLALTTRGTGARVDGVILTSAFQSALIPALTGVGLIASTFTAEKENQTLVPLLAAPIRDIDIVVGKLVGMLLPVEGICVGSLAVFYAIAIRLYGLERVQRVLTPELIYAIVVLSFLYVLTVGSWVLIVAARVRTSRAAQQIAGLMIGFSIIVLGGAAVGSYLLLEGWGIVVLGALLVVADAVALEVARRAWQRGEVIARI